MHDVIVVGGGPVGLYTALLLRQAGLDAVVLERRTERSDHSRASASIRRPCARWTPLASLTSSAVAVCSSVTALPAAPDAMWAPSPSRPSPATRRMCSPSPRPSRRRSSSADSCGTSPAR
ncbi:FAD-dependent oxidoreductase [Vibrio cholerae]|nr:FAD-dependent oxidoreductase [Vibrio cholerae]